MASQYEKRKAKEKVAEAPFTEAAAVIETVYDGTAYDMVHDPETKSYFRIEVEYDTKTGAARIKNRKLVTMSQPVAMQKMHELFTRKILGLKFE